MAGTTFSVTINMSGNTAMKLTDAGSMLYAFKAVRCSDKAGLPLVWSVTSQLMPTTVVSWTSPYTGYVSMSAVVPGTLIVPGYQTPLPIGSTLDITSSIGTGTVTATGAANACSIRNSTTTEFSCGLAQSAAGAAALPLCAFPMYGGNLVAITPLEAVLLTFSTLSIAPGTAVTSMNVTAKRTSLATTTLAVSTTGVLIDMTGVTQRSISYDINLGWQWGGATWGMGVPASANLREWLIQPDVN